MGLILTASPACEPLSLDDVKAHLRLDGHAEDALLQSLILTSRMHIEAALGLALINQGWLLTIDDWKLASSVRLPIRPLRRVDSISIRNGANESSYLTEASYRIEEPDALPTIRLSLPDARLLKQVPPICVVIAFQAGYGPQPNSVPAPIRQAMLLLTAHWYEHRDPAEIGSQEANIPAAISGLLQTYAVRRI